MPKIRPHNPKKRKLFNECKDSPSGRHQFTRWVEKGVMLGTHCHYCGKIGKLVHGR